MPHPMKSKIFILSLILGCLLMLNPVGLDMFLPAVPNIARGLDTTSNQIMNSMSSLFFGNAMGRLVLGPLSDRYGRKPIIFLTLIIFTGSAFASSLASSIEFFIFFRFIQGFSIAGGHVFSLSVARDLFEKEQLGKIIANAAAIMGLAGIVFPILGGQIIQFMPWQSIFWVMSIFGLTVFLFVMFSYTETIKQKNLRAVNARSLLLNWFKIINDPVFLRYALCSSFVSAGFFAYVTVSPTLLREVFGISAFGYGLSFAFLALSFVISNLIAGQLVLRIGQSRLLWIGGAMAVLGSGMMLGLSIMEIDSPIAIIIPTAIYFFAIGWIAPQANALALQPFEYSAGTASALLGFISMVVSAFTGFILSFAVHDDATYLGLAMLIASFLSFLIYLLLIQKVLK
jgi:DHA1 family bicyclomycin/chloramphenicol resistance-like MFS transporter